FQGMGHPNHKPPFMSLVQVLFYKLMGDTNIELAIRLPIALGSLALLAFFPYFSQKKLGTPSWGILAGLVLISSKGYNAIHVGKTGDHDAALAVIMAFGLFCFYQYTVQLNRKRQLFYLAMLSLSFLLAYLTKSVMGFFFVFGFIAYAIIKGKILSILKDPAVYLAFIFLAAGVGVYHVFLDQLASSKHSLMHFQGLKQYVDIHPSQTHNHPWDYYFYRLKDSQFYPFAFLLPIGVSVAFNKNFPILRDLSLLSFLSALSFFLVISFSVTKLEWYDAALYPPLAMLTASGIYMIWRALESYLAKSVFFSPSLKYILLFLLFFFPYFWINSQFHVYKLLYPGEKFAYIMEQINRKLEVKKYYLAAPMGNPHVSFYTAYYNKNKDFDILLKDQTEDFRVGDHVLVCHDEFIDALKERYELHRAEMYDQCRFYEIKGIKEQKEAASPQ
ncbi:MAG: glycosyltransferase family 39 protein, partial [Bacteroidota bacterium]